jgi:hypothetical protein
LQVVDDALKHTVRECEVGDGDLRIIANDFVKDSFVRELVHLSQEGYVGLIVECLSCRSCFAYVLEIGDCAGVGGPAVAGGLQHLRYLGVDSGGSTRCTGTWYADGCEGSEVAIASRGIEVGVWVHSHGYS